MTRAAAAKNVLVSGASGFVGLRLVQQLVNAGHHVTALVRSMPKSGAPGVKWAVVGDLSKDKLDPNLGAGADVLVHLAASLRPTSTDGDGSQSQTAAMARNVCDLVEAAKIPRVVVMSSVAASIAERDPLHARRYGTEKLAADGIFADRLTGRHQFVILRPPAVYGPGMRNSLSVLAGLVRRGLPIPLGLATAKRDYISLRNLADLLVALVGGDDAMWTAVDRQVLEPSDGQPVSTAELIRMMGEAMGRPARLLPVPLGLMRLAGSMTGRSELVAGAVDGLTVKDNGLMPSIPWAPEEKMPASLSFLRDGGRSVR